MKNTIQKILSFVLATVISASLSATAFADNWFQRNHVLYFIYGGSVTVPGSFEYYYDPQAPSQYKYYNKCQDMLIILNEVNYAGDCCKYSVIDETYNNYVRSYPKAIFDTKSYDSFTISGYIDSVIYYINYTMSHDVLYSLKFYYPEYNRFTCDKIVESVCESFNTSVSNWTPDWNNHPSRADLDTIRANVKYPNYDFMYLDHYITANVTHKAVYCFKDPDNDIWRKGNYFTVYYGTKVTILAESQGYACVILNDTLQAGWINCDYLSNH